MNPCNCIFFTHSTTVHQGSGKESNEQGYESRLFISTPLIRDGTPDWTNVRDAHHCLGDTLDLTPPPGCADIEEGRGKPVPEGNRVSQFVPKLGVKQHASQRHNTNMKVGVSSLPILTDCWFLPGQI